MVNEVFYPAQEMPSSTLQGMYQNAHFDPTSSSPTQMQDDLWKDVINPEPIIERIELTLQGYTYEENQGVWIKVYPEMLNPKGRGLFMFFIRNMISKNILMANLKEEDIRLRCKINRNNLISYLAKNHEEIGLNKQHLGLVLSSVDDNISSIFSRGKDATQLRYLSTSTRRLESFVQRNQDGSGQGQQKKGFFNFFKAD